MSDRVNREIRKCLFCRLPVPALGGVEFELQSETVCAHLVCRITGRPEVVAVRDFAGDVVGIVNRTGRCEDAPYCGCCGGV
jgi:hypothetical protein